MRTIALRIGENIAPPEGTIMVHQNMIEENGYVWYGKFGSPVSGKVFSAILEIDNPRILLIQSGRNKRY